MALFLKGCDCGFEVFNAGFGGAGFPGGGCGAGCGGGFLGRLVGDGRGEEGWGGTSSWGGEGGGEEGAGGSSSRFSATVIGVPGLGSRTSGALGTVGLFSVMRYLCYTVFLRG